MEKYFINLKTYLNSDTKPKTFNFIALFFLISFFVFHQFVPYGMNLGIMIACLVFIAYKNGHKLSYDFLLPIILFYIYEVLRSNAYNFAKFFDIPLIVTPIIKLESKIFFFMDAIPNVALQDFFDPVLQNPMWYDYVLFFVYGIFFWFWAVVAFVIWFYKKEFFYKYIYSLLFFSFFSVIIFAILPTAPPWYASEIGVIEPVSRLLWDFNYFEGLEISGTKDYGRNDFAAIPSLHTGWSFFAALWITKVFGKKGIIAFTFPLGIAFATWYGAEHYVIDSVIGAAMAIVFFWIGLKYKLVFKPKIRIQKNI